MVTCQKNLGSVCIKKKNFWLLAKPSRHKTASTHDGLPEISKMKYRNRIPEPGTTISGFANSQKFFFLMQTVPSG
jgi:hypothetical protein